MITPILAESAVRVRKTVTPIVLSKALEMEAMENAYRARVAELDGWLALRTHGTRLDGGARMREDARGRARARGREKEREERDEVD